MSQEASALESDKKLRKALTLQDLFFMSMGAIIGSGWLYAVAAGGSVAGPAAIISWIIGGILVLFVALNYAEISGAIPRSGAIVRYPHLTHGPFTGYIMGWAYLLSAVTVPTIEAEAVIGYASTYIPSLMHGTVLSPIGILVGIVLLVVFFFLNYLGIRFLGKFNSGVTWWKFILPTLTFIFLMIVFNKSNFTNYGGFTPFGSAPIFLAIPTAGIVFSYLGFRQALEFGGEAKNPQRDVPLATILSVVAAIIIYTLLQVAFIGGIKWTTFGLTPGNWSALGEYGSGPISHAPFYIELRYSGVALLAAFSVLLLIDAWISPSGTAWIYLGNSARVFYGIAADGYFPKIFLRIYEKTRIPLFALIAALVVGSIFLAPFPSWYSLVGFISSSTVLTYLMGGVNLASLRKVAPEMHRPYRMPAASILAPLGYLAAIMIVYWSGYTTLFYIFTAIFIGFPILLFLYAPYKLGVPKTFSYTLGIVEWIIIGLLSWFGYVYTVSSPNILDFAIYWVLLFATILGTFFVLSTKIKPEYKKALGASYWLIVLMFATYLISFIGAFGPLSSPLIPFPYDNIVEIVIGLIIYYWAIRVSYRTEELEKVLKQQYI